MKQRARLRRMFIFVRVSRLNGLDPMDAVDAELSAGTAGAIVVVIP